LPKKWFLIFIAEFIDVIHSDKIVMGTKWNSGHADFWPNNGKNQGNCTKFQSFDINSSAC
jgi:hypothetical protein